ncbi:hypothetical protein ZHAS_00013512 [Anopheles sinensis]|uniref:Uncharacterized protein n=1 Tax=Anopheles sinensis TaxID=74873 RepID=A0A084W611_ANOSI|nr:hypothetical protein ZHAS_00013512 [Anopheles sinensis]
MVSRILVEVLNVFKPNEYLNAIVNFTRDASIQNGGTNSSPFHLHRSLPPWFGVVQRNGTKKSTEASCARTELENGTPTRNGRERETRTRVPGVQELSRKKASPRRSLWRRVRGVCLKPQPRRASCVVAGLQPTKMSSPSREDGALRTDDDDEDGCGVACACWNIMDRRTLPVRYGDKCPGRLSAEGK